MYKFFIILIVKHKYTLYILSHIVILSQWVASKVVFFHDFQELVVTIFRVGSLVSECGPGYARNGDRLALFA